jgi:hypothetical protein
MTFYGAGAHQIKLKTISKSYLLNLLLFRIETNIGILSKKRREQYILLLKVVVL